MPTNTCRKFCKETRKPGPCADPKSKRQQMLTRRGQHTSKPAATKASKPLAKPQGAAKPPAAGRHVQNALRVAEKADVNGKWQADVIGHMRSLGNLPQSHLTAIARSLGHTGPIGNKEGALMAVHDQIANRIKARRDNPARLLSERAVKTVKKMHDCKACCAACASGKPCEGKVAKLADEPPELVTVPGIEMFATGVYRGKDYSTADLDALVENFHRLSDPKLPVRLLTPTAVLGHEENGDENRFWANLSTGVPSVGVVTKLWRDGNTLMGDVGDMLPEVARAIKAKLYRKCSCELYDSFEDDHGHQWGPALRRLAFLGGEIPQVKSLADLPVSGFSEKVPMLHYTYAELRVRSRVLRGPDGKWYWPGIEKFGDLFPATDKRSRLSDAAQKSLLAFLAANDKDSVDSRHARQVIEKYCQATHKPGPCKGQAKGTSQATPQTGAVGGGQRTTQAIRGAVGRVAGAAKATAAGVGSGAQKAATGAVKGAVAAVRGGTGAAKVGAKVVGRTLGLGKRLLGGALRIGAKAIGKTASGVARGVHTANKAIQKEGLAGAAGTGAENAIAATGRGVRRLALGTVGGALGAAAGGIVGAARGLVKGAVRGGVAGAVGGAVGGAVTGTAKGLARGAVAGSRIGQAAPAPVAPRRVQVPVEIHRPGRAAGVARQIPASQIRVVPHSEHYVADKFCGGAGSKKPGPCPKGRENAHVVMRAHANAAFHQAGRLSGDTQETTWRKARRLGKKATRLEGQHRATQAKKENTGFRKRPAEQTISAHTVTVPMGSWKWQKAGNVRLTQHPADEAPDSRRKGHQVIASTGKLATETRRGKELLGHYQRRATEKIREKLGVDKESESATKHCDSPKHPGPCKGQHRGASRGILGRIASAPAAALRGAGRQMKGMAVQDQRAHNALMRNHTVLGNLKETAKEIAVVPRALGAAALGAVKGVVRHLKPAASKQAPQSATAAPIPTAAPTPASPQAALAKVADQGKTAKARIAGQKAVHARARDLLQSAKQQHSIAHQLGAPRMVQDATANLEQAAQHHQKAKAALETAKAEHGPALKQAKAALGTAKKDLGHAAKVAAAELKQAAAAHEKAGAIHTHMLGTHGPDSEAAQVTAGDVHTARKQMFAAHVKHQAAKTALEHARGLKFAERIRRFSETVHKHCQATHKPGPCKGAKKGAGGGLLKKVGGAVVRGVKALPGLAKKAVLNNPLVGEFVANYKAAKGSGHGKRKALVKGVANKQFAKAAGKKAFKVVAERLTGLSPDLYHAVKKDHGRLAGGLAAGLYAGVNNAINLGTAGVALLPGIHAVKSGLTYGGILGASKGIQLAKQGAGKAIGAVAGVADRALSHVGQRNKKLEGRLRGAIAQTKADLQKGHANLQAIGNKIADKSVQLGKAALATPGVRHAVAAGKYLGGKVQSIAPEALKAGKSALGGVGATLGSVAGGAVAGAKALARGKPKQALKKAVGGIRRGTGKLVGGLGAAVGHVKRAIPFFSEDGVAKFCKETRKPGPCKGQKRGTRRAAAPASNPVADHNAAVKEHRAARIAHEVAHRVHGRAARALTSHHANLRAAQAKGGTTVAKHQALYAKALAKSTHTRAIASQAADRLVAAQDHLANTRRLAGV